MIVNINGDINRFYVQTLCLIFFPGAKFSESEELTENTTVVDVAVRDNETNIYSRVDIKCMGKMYRGESTISREEKFTRPQMAVKICVGRAFLEAGKKMGLSSVPWGILTGVRPSKFALSNLERGMNTEECISSLMTEFGVSPAKARLAASVAESEREIIRKAHYKECSVYIAIPFCPTRCSYCSFVSFTSKRLLDLIPQYIEVLKKEIISTFKLIEEIGIRVSSVYIGGGTPTVLNENQLEDLLSTVFTCTDVTKLDEYTLEAGRPDTITSEKLECAKKYGVTRISVNPQSLNDEILKNIGRDHTVEDFYNAYETAREVGIDCINIDLIAGLPGDTYDSFRTTLDGIMALDPENITVHTFCVKKAADVRKKDEHVYNSRHESAALSVDYACETLLGAYVPYYMYRQKNTMGNLENTGWAKKGYEGLYNIFMMEEIHSVFAVGASAVTKLVHRDADGKVTMERIFENKYPFEYLSEKTNEEYTKSDFCQKVKEFYSKYN